MKEALKTLTLTSRCWRRGSKEELKKLRREGWGHPHGKFCEDANRVYGHPEDKDYVAWGAHGHFGQYGPVEDVSSIISIATGDFELHLTVTRKSFLDIPNMLLYRVWQIFVIVEGRRHRCWSCDAKEHLSKACPLMTSVPQSKLTASEESIGSEKTDKVNESQKWKEMM